jgi:radical SAM-linked protein
MDLKRYKVTIFIHKSGEMVYISQLDLNRLLIRAAHRAGLPLYYTQGHNPHPKFSFSNALKLGVEGTIEVVLHLTEDMSAEQAAFCLQSQFPDGLAVSF